MKIRNEQEKKMLRDAIKRCSGYVALVSSTSGREYDLKNDEMQAEAFAKLALDSQESMELFVAKREDIEVMMGLMDRLARENRAAENYNERKAA